MKLQSVQFSETSYNSLERGLYLLILLTVSSLGFVLFVPLFLVAQVRNILHPQKAANKSIKIGEILVSKKLISQDQLQQVLLEQRSTYAKLGELLLAKNWISIDHLNEALREQSYVSTI